MLNAVTTLNPFGRRRRFKVFEQSDDLWMLLRDLILSERRECELSPSNLLFFLKEALMKGAEINFFLRRFILFFFVAKIFKKMGISACS